MNNSNLHKPFLLTLTVILVLLGLFYVPRTNIFGHQLRRVNILSDIQRRNAEGRLLVDIEQDKAEGITDQQFDSTAVEVHTVVFHDSVPEGMTAIEDFSADSMHRVMDIFYEALNHAAERPVRIAYFGDSYIEGDIITAPLRDSFQRTYGGNGVGYVDINSITAGFRQSIRANAKGWTDHNANDDRSRHFDTKLQSIAGKYYIAGKTASVDMQCPKGTRADIATIFFTPGNGLHLTASIDNSEYSTLYSDNQEQQLTAETRAVHHQHIDTIYAADSLTFTLDTTVTTTYVTDSVGTQLFGNIHTRSTEQLNRLRLQVSNGESSRFYGVTFDGKTGVSVDNFSMRGSNGWYLANIPSATLDEFSRLRPYDLIILHFGLNVANENQVNYSGYTIRMQRSIEHLRQAYPDAAILVISVADRDERTEDGELRTMRGVRELVSYQRKMAADTHVAFWNLYQAMGGEGSVYRMAQQHQANLDYTHLNFAGGRRIASLLFDVLKNGKENYDRRK